ncbi:MAG: hypothetical protein GY804_08945 [Alphaproteobacteria bacterium]|nr:hypothetical protein [Alphaproteobacteria bacterium]
MQKTINGLYQCSCGSWYTTSDKMEKYLRDTSDRDNIAEVVLSCCDCGHKSIRGIENCGGESACFNRLCIEKDHKNLLQFETLPLVKTMPHDSAVIAETMEGGLYSYVKDKGERIYLKFKHED